jgi:hypothetical protein
MSIYLIPADIPGGKWTGEIESVERGQLATYLRFRGIKKALAVQTAHELSEVYRAHGRDWTRWAGKKVTIHADPCAQYTAPIRITADIERARIEPTPVRFRTVGETPERLPGIKNQGWIGGAFNH